MTHLENSRVLVTGGSRGIGRLVAGLLADRGAHVVIWSRDADRLEEAVRAIRERGGSAEAQICDVSDRTAVYAAAKELEARGGPVDVLVNNAGVVSGRPLMELGDDEIERTMRINALAHFWTTKALLPSMLARDAGHLVTVSSAAGLVGVAGLTDYCASKFAAFGFHEALRMELRKVRSKIKTTIVCPYYIDTGMFEGVRTRFSPLLPILAPERVALAIVHAIERNRPRVLMPPIVFTVPLFRILPVGAMDASADLLGLNASMDTFVGRVKPPASATPRARPSRRAGPGAGRPSPAHP